MCICAQLRVPGNEASHLNYDSIARVAMVNFQLFEVLLYDLSAIDACYLWLFSTTASRIFYGLREGIHVHS